MCIGDIEGETIILFIYKRQFDAVKREEMFSAIWLYA